MSIETTKRHRVLDHMTDVDGAKRLLIMWVPKSAGKAWMTSPWGFRAGRLWVQFSPNVRDHRWLPTPDTKTP